MDNSCDEWNDIHVWHMMVCFGHNKMPGPKNGIQEWYTGMVYSRSTLCSSKNSAHSSITTHETPCLQVILLVQR